MKNLNQALKEDYSEKMNSLKFSDKRKLYKLYEEPKHTPVLRKVVVMNVALACLILAFGVSATAVGFTTLSEVVANKTKDLNITDEKRDEITETLNELNIPIEDFASNQNELSVNNYGEVIGSFMDGADLIAVAGTNADGKSITGYCYKNDYFEVSGLNITGNPEERIEKSDAMINGKVRNWIYVYDADGTTILGKLVAGEFKTTEQLEDSDVYALIANGDDLDEYEALSQSRIDKKTNK